VRVAALALAVALLEEDEDEAEASVPALRAVRSGLLALERRMDSASFIRESCILRGEGQTEARSRRMRERWWARRKDGRGGRRRCVERRWNGRGRGEVVIFGPKDSIRAYHTALHIHMW
jgi:hypothetical protein